VTAQLSIQELFPSPGKLIASGGKVCYENRG